MEETSKKAGVYCRVSSLEQAKEGISLEAQKEKLESYCKIKEWKIIKVEQEVKSAKDTNRPKLKKMLEAVKQGSINVLVVFKLDRLGRSLSDLIQMSKYLKEYNCDFCSISEEINTTTATGKLFFHILGAFAQFENDIKKERVELSFDKLRNEGRILSRPPLGYTLRAKKLVPDSNAEKIKEAFRLTIEGVRAEDICDRLIITKKTKKGSYSKTRLPLGTYYRAMRNKVYTGIYTFGGEEQKGDFEPLISLESFEEVQKIIDKRRWNKNANKP